MSLPSRRSFVAEAGSKTYPGESEMQAVTSEEFEHRENALR
jgi:hypothetical protein